MHVLDLPGDGTALGCNMPPTGTIGPLFRYSKRQNRSMLFTDNTGKACIEMYMIYGRFWEPGSIMQQSVGYTLLSRISLDNIACHILGND